MQGDQVLVELEPPKADGRRIGRIARILEPPQPHRRRHLSLRKIRAPAGPPVVPFDERMTQPILIRAGDETRPRRKQASPHRVLGSEARRRTRDTTTSKASSSTSKSPPGPRPRGPPWAASSKSWAIPTTSASTSR